MQATDQELVRLFTQGDSAAFEELVKRHEQRIYNLSLRMLGRPEDARDATQETFLAALRKLPSFRGDSALSTWLHRVAVNSCYDILRRRKRRAEESLPENPGPAPGDVAESASEAIDVQRALVTVPEEFRAASVLVAPFTNSENLVPPELFRNRIRSTEPVRLFTMNENRTYSSFRVGEIDR